MKADHTTKLDRGVFRNRSGHFHENVPSKLTIVLAFESRVLQPIIPAYSF